MSAPKLEAGLLLRALAAMSDGQLILDERWQVRYANPCAAQLLGLAPNEGLAFSQVGTLRARDGQAVTREHVEERYALGVNWEEPDGTLERADGTRTPASFSVTRLPGTGEVAWLLSMTDIAERKQSERALREARIEAEVAKRSQAQRGRFVANMSHELRTPLNAIIGYAELLREEEGTARSGSPASQTHADLSRIIGAGKHLLNLVNDVLDLSKIDAGRMELVEAEVDVRELVTSLGADVQQLVERRHNRLELRLGDDLGIMRTDERKLRQILYNLVGNAAKFTEQGHVTVRVVRRANTVHFAVTDDGIGIDADSLPKLFRAFSQADSSISERYGGTGLGLALVKATAELLGGQVSVTSALGQGSTFEVALPADRVSASRRASGRAESRSSSASSTP